MKQIQIIFASLMLLGLLPTSALKAQMSNPKILKSQIMEASADDVWERLRQIDGLETIVPDMLQDSWIIGDAEPGAGVKRSCAAPGTPKGQASYTE